ncbi:Clavaminate synthase-like protein [Rhizodiscina lignyota]|uniref:Clavaminate synthase-like protein n=1 Tax=Rhizodiscina lignyota TaxID=1504668 RepID=A0A9P4I3E3_9PEZI|nr:Clavaminate synthase-like protein [Rhizodiscina lignyota]
MATVTQTVQTQAEPEYVYFHYDGVWGHKREVLKGSCRKQTFTEIPVVDIARLYSQDVEERIGVAKEIIHACENVGFFYIQNHGIPQDLIHGTLESNKKYFNKPLDEKMQQYIYKSRNLRGYEPVHGARVDATKATGDRKESFLFSYDPEEDEIVPELTEEQRALLSHNLWPEDDEGFRKQSWDYHRALLRLARKMMQAFALGLGEKETYFDELVTAPLTSIKKIHYPPQDLTSTDETGIGAHTDFVCFTILHQDNTGGLDVLNANAEWVPAPPIPGTFVVNIGDFLMRLTNNRFLSTVHRVKNVSGKDRYSMPFFFSFGMHDFVSVLPSCCGPDNPPKYEPITVSDYYKRRHEIQKKAFADRQSGKATVYS